MLFCWYIFFIFNLLVLDVTGERLFYNSLSVNAGVAQLVERHVANVQVDGSNPFTRSNLDF